MATAVVPRYVEKLRRAHIKAIDENPVDITITRTERVRDGGGFREVHSTFYIRGRVYQEATGRSGDQEQVTVPAVQHIDARWGLITGTTMRTADNKEVPTALKGDSKGGDEFDHPLGRFRIVVVYPREDAGITWGWQAALERVH